MRNHLPRFIMLSIAGWLAFSPLAHAGEEVFDIDSRFRAKIAKEKLKQGFAAAPGADRATARATTPPAANAAARTSATSTPAAARPAAAPREVFVFAPNAINLVTGCGCR